MTGIFRVQATGAGFGMLMIQHDGLSQITGELLCLNKKHGCVLRCSFSINLIALQAIFDLLTTIIYTVSSFILCILRARPDADDAF